ncbi:MAG TPA: DUF1579 family protein [Longimicrobiaceae bacterium]|nr:DUF1579 family protein [Longimicrobiaceae bacterium]
MSLDALLACAGYWHGTSTLLDPSCGVAEESLSRATVAPVLDGRFVRLDYTWSYQGAPQEGSLLLGMDPKTSLSSAHWIDTWHMGRAVMACQGGASNSGALSVRGSYAAPPGPDWGWRIDVIPEEEGMLRVTMFNISPGGEEELAVNTVYRRD